MDTKQNIIDDEPNWQEALDRLNKATEDKNKISAAEFTRYEPIISAELTDDTRDLIFARRDEWRQRFSLNHPVIIYDREPNQVGAVPIRIIPPIMPDTSTLSDIIDPMKVHILLNGFANDVAAETSGNPRGHTYIDLMTAVCSKLVPPPPVKESTIPVTNKQKNTVLIDGIECEVG